MARKMTSIAHVVVEAAIANIPPWPVVGIVHTQTGRRQNLAMRMYAARNIITVIAAAADGAVVMVVIAVGNRVTQIQDGSCTKQQAHDFTAVSRPGRSRGQAGQGQSRRQECCEKSFGHYAILSGVAAQV